MEDNNLFLTGYGAVYHYNGKNWYSYKELEAPEMVYFEPWSDGQEVFITATKRDSKTYIFHGK